jgi:ATP adenylyltransferase
MERMWSPWRSKYIASFKKERKRKGQNESVFSRAFKSRRDDANMIVWRSKYCFVIMNRYPYNSGHVMVVPNRQTADIADLTAAESADIMATIQQTIQALQEALNPQGFNIGANLGRVGGAGVDTHIHFHIVPRWLGDTNFMPVVADVKVVSEEIVSVLHKLRRAFSAQKSPKSKRR